MGWHSFCACVFVGVHEHSSFATSQHICTCGQKFVEGFQELSQCGVCRSCSACLFRPCCSLRTAPTHLHLWAEICGRPQHICTCGQKFVEGSRNCHNAVYVERYSACVALTAPYGRPQHIRTCGQKFENESPTSPKK